MKCGRAQGTDTRAKPFLTFLGCGGKCLSPAVQSSEADATPCRVVVHFVGVTQGSLLRATLSWMIKHFWCSFLAVAFGLPTPRALNLPAQGWADAGGPTLGHSNKPATLNGLHQSETLCSGKILHSCVGKQCEGVMGTDTNGTFRTARKVLP